jgi:hypothetical protein
MVYAVCSKVYAQFQRALGRLVAWGFDAPGDSAKLWIRPHVREEGANASYDKRSGQLRFGYYEAPPEGIGRNAPKACVFTCLSHDIIAHEFTHALLDGLRSHFTIPTSAGVLGFHEGFADLVAVFQHFTYPQVLEREIRRRAGGIDQSTLLGGIAENFGLTTNRRGPLRCAIGGKDLRYHENLEAHDMGSVLLTALFEAFVNVYRRRTEPFIRLAYTPPSGYLAAELVSFLAAKASETAGRFLEMCIRAIDYCPPVDIQLGEFLRALITADRDLVAEDPWGYRDALIDAFAAHGIYPPGVGQLSEDSLVWRPPERSVPPIEALHFANLRFQGDPSLPADPSELTRQASVLWDVVNEPYNRPVFGLEGPDSADPPVIESIRTSRRVGPDGELLFDLVAEVTQRRIVGVGNQTAKFFGGSTVILGPRGEIRYVIAKRVGDGDRLERQLEFQRESGYWENYRMKGYAHQLAHRHK